MTTPTRGLRAAILLTVALVLLASCSTSGSDAADDAAGGAATTTSASKTTTTGAEPKVDDADLSLLDDRPVDIHVPPGYEDGTPAPLVVLLHGFGATGDLQEQYLQLQQATDDAGMLFAAPDGTVNMIGKQFWNATDACCAGPAVDEVDDSAYLRAVIAKAQQDHDVDPKRIFIVGHSNGGFMAYRMACDHADVVAAVISLEGATYDDPAACSPSEPVATLEVHGTGDTTIPYDGGTIIGHTFPSAPETAAMWAEYNGCASEPDDPAPPARDIEKDLPEATVTSYSGGCDPGGHAELWTQEDGVHIPAWSDTFAEQLVGWLQDHPKP